MKTLTSLTTGLILIFSNLNAQAVLWEFHSEHVVALNEYKAYSITETRDKGYVFAGRSGANGTGNSDFYIGKLSSTGSLLWEKAFGTTLSDELRAVKELPDSSLIALGFTVHYGDDSDSSYVKNILLRLTPQGDTIWTKRYYFPGNSIGEGMGCGIEPSDDGGFVFTSKVLNGSNGNDFLLVKTDGNGDLLWTKKYGGSGADIPRALIRTSDGGYMVAGTTRSFGVNPAAGNFWLLKTDSNGDTLWTRTIGGAAEEECFSVRQTRDGGYILAGRTGNILSAASDLYIVKTDASGNVEWSKTLGNPEDNDTGRDIIQTQDGGYVLTGGRAATHGYFLLFPVLMYVVKMDSLGNEQWDVELGYDNTPNGAHGLSVLEASDGGIVVAGHDQPDSPHSGTADIRAFVVKLQQSQTAGEELLQDKRENILLAYPNPFSELTYIHIPEEIKSAATLDVYNKEGKKILSRIIEPGRPFISIHKNELSPGMYFCFISGKDMTGSAYRGKIIAR